MQSYYTIFSTLIGSLTAIEQGGYLTDLKFGTYPLAAQINQETALLSQLRLELDLYFAGKLRTFSVPLKPNGTIFQQKAWSVLKTIPYGKTISYQEQAIRMHHPSACRAVGMANHRNPIPILIPCHRVIGKNKKLTGYGGGLDIKQFLLDLEKGL